MTRKRLTPTARASGTAQEKIAANSSIIDTLATMVVALEATDQEIQGTQAQQQSALDSEVEDRQAADGVIERAMTELRSTVTDLRATVSALQSAARTGVPHPHPGSRGWPGDVGRLFLATRKRGLRASDRKHIGSAGVLRRLYDDDNHYDDNPDDLQEDWATVPGWLGPRWPQAHTGTTIQRVAVIGRA